MVIVSKARLEIEVLTVRRQAVTRPLFLAREDDPGIPYPQALLAVVASREIVVATKRSALRRGRFAERDCRTNGRHFMREELWEAVIALWRRHFMAGTAIIQGSRFPRHKCRSGLENDCQTDTRTET